MAAAVLREEGTSDIPNDVLMPKYRSETPYPPPRFLVRRTILLGPTKKMRAKGSKDPLSKQL